MPQVYIPAELRPAVQGATVIAVPGTSVAAVIDAVDTLHPGFRAQVCQGSRLRPGLMASINGNFATRGLREPVTETDEVHFLPALGGG